MSLRSVPHLTQTTRRKNCTAEICALTLHQHAQHVADGEGAKVLALIVQNGHGQNLVVAQSLWRTGRGCGGVGDRQRGS